MKKVLIPILTLGLCLTVIGVWTEGFQAFTVFSYTLKKAGNLPRQLPDIPMIDQNGHVFHLNQNRGYLLVNFVYLDCPNVCHKVDNRLEEIYHKMPNYEIPNQLRFLTVSFDQKYDNIKKIRRYRKMFGPGITGWRFALPYQTDNAQFQNYLKKVGIWMHRVPHTRLINHATYIFLVSPDNKIVRIFDPARDSNQMIIKNVESCLDGRTVSSR